MRRILSWPWPDEANPYVLRLGEALRARGVEVTPARYLARHCLRPAGARWLHVHWPEWIARAPTRAGYYASTAWLLTLLDAARAQGVSIAWTAHNLFPHDDPHPDLGRRARAALLRRCAVVFGHFPSAEADVRALGFVGRFALTPHAHYARDYPEPFAGDADRAAFRRSLGVADGDTLLVSTGSIAGYKNLAAVAGALAEARAPGVRYLVAGRIDDAAAYDQLLRRARGTSSIDLRPGFVERGELARIVAAADASVLAYRAFYTSGAAVLSLTLGTPVMGPPRHHLAMYAGERFFFPLGADGEVDPATITDAITRLRSAGTGLREEARAAALRCSWEGAAATIEETLFA